MKPKVCALFLLTCLFPTLGLAQQPWEGAAFSGKPEAIAAAARTAVGTDATKTVVLLDERNIALDASHRMTLTQRVVYRLGSDMEGWTTAQVSYRPWRQQKPVLRARVITPEGRELQLDQKAIAESPMRDLGAEVFGDSRLLRGPLPALTSGAVVEFHTLVTDTAPLFDRGMAQYLGLGYTSPTLRTRITLEAPVEMALKYVTRWLPDVTPDRSTSRGKVTVKFDIGRLEPPKDIVALAAGERPLLGFSTAGSWNDIADGYQRIVESRIGTSDLTAVVREALGNATTRDEKLSRLLSMVQKEIRYSAVMLAEAGTVPTPPEETLRLKYGDCKDQAALLVAMLRSAGIESYIALLNASDGADATDVEPDLPGFGGFNHAIVYVPGETPLWLDPTTGFSRLGQLPDSDMGRLALIAKAGTNALVQIPQVASQLLDTQEVFLAENGSARIEHTSTSLGSEEIAARALHAAATEETLREELTSMAKGLYVAETIRNLRHSDPRDFSGPLQIQFEVADSAIAQTAGAEAAFGIPLRLLMFEPLLAMQIYDASSRKGKSLMLGGHLIKEWRYRIVPPAGFENARLPENRTEKFGPAVFSQEFAAGADGAVTGFVRFDSGKKEYTAAEADELRKGLKKFEDHPALTISFDSIGETRLQSGNIRGALEEFRRLASLHPAEAFHRFQIARALLDAGIGNAAHAEARRAVELESDSSFAYKMLGFVLHHDSLGRPYGPGADFMQASAALARALELDENDKDARRQLARLLEYNTAGVRYGAGADLSGAIEHYREVVKSPGDDGSDDLSMALLYAGQFSDAKSATSRPDFILAAIAASDGVDAAVREAGRLVTDAANRQGALTRGAALLLNLRLYKEAAGLYQAGARGAANALPTLDFAERLAKTQRSEDLILPESDPTTPAKKLMIGLVLGKPDSELLPLFAKAEQVNWPESLRRFRDLRSMFLSARAGGMPVAIQFDQILANLKSSSDGSDATGYRVNFEPMIDDRFFVIKEDGQYRIGRQTSEKQGKPEQKLASDALDRVNRGDAVGARRLLDQASDAVRSGADDGRYVGALSAFLTGWTKGYSSTPDEIRIAAASLLSGSPEASRVLPTLLDLRKKVIREDQKSNLDLALVSAYMWAGQPDESLRRAGLMIQQNPTSIAFEFVLAWVDEIDRPAGFKTFLQKRLDKKPRDEDALRAMANVDKQLGNFERAEAFYRSAVQTARDMRPEDREELVRLALFHDKVTEADLEAARQMGPLSLSPAMIRTVAALEAELDRTTQAREMLLQAMSRSGHPQPEPDDWYVIGRIYEAFGERPAAIAAYEKVARPEIRPNRADSMFALAQRRLKALQ